MKILKLKTVVENTYVITDEGWTIDEAVDHFEDLVADLAVTHSLNMDQEIEKVSQGTWEKIKMIDSMIKGVNYPERLNRVHDSYRVITGEDMPLDRVDDILSELDRQSED